MGAGVGKQARHRAEKAVCAYLRQGGWRTARTVYNTCAADMKYGTFCRKVLYRLVQKGLVEARQHTGQFGEPFFYEFCIPKVKAREGSDARTEH